MFTTDCLDFLTKLEKDPGAVGKKGLFWAIDADPGTIRETTINPAVMQKKTHLLRQRLRQSISDREYFMKNLQLSYFALT